MGLNAVDAKFLCVQEEFSGYTVVGVVNLSSSNFAESKTPLLRIP